MERWEYNLLVVFNFFLVVLKSQIPNPIYLFVLIFSVTNFFLDALASLKTMLDIQSERDVFMILRLQIIREYDRVLQSVREYYRVLQSITDCCRVLQSITEY